MSLPIDTTEEVLSGEAVAIDVLPLGFFMRALGALIDMVLSFALMLLFIWMRGWLLDVVYIDPAIDRILNVLMLVACFLLIPVTIEVITRGRSLGKLTVGGRIVRLDGGGIGFRQAFIRGLLGVLEIYMTLGAVAVLTGIFSARSQRLGDMVAGTYSQRVRTPKLAWHAPVLPVSLQQWAPLADVARMPDRLARRISQFLQNAERMAPAARARVATDLAAEVAPFVSPLPAVPPEHLLAGVTVIRRERELRALRIADARTERLTGRQVAVPVEGRRAAQYR